MKTKIISLLNLKGGVGKSTICINLAAQFSINKKVVVLDLDPQQSATRWSQFGGGSFPCKVIPLAVGDNISSFKQEFNQIINSSKPDIIFMDNPPELAIQSQVCCLLSDLVLIPVSPSPLDLWATERALNLVNDAREETGDSKPTVIFVPSKLQTGTIVSRDLSSILESFNEVVAPPIYQRVAVVEACMAGTTVNQYKQQSFSNSEFANLRKFINPYVSI